MQRFAIIGGGIAGLTTAIGLSQIGIQADIYEAATELKGIGAGFGLAANAMQALSTLGLQAEVLQLGHLLPDYNILDQRGDVLISPDTARLSRQYRQSNFAIHRADLHQFLLSKIPSTQLHLGKRAIRLKQNANGSTVTFEDGSSIDAEYFIIADGVKSSLRQQLDPTSTPRYSGYTCWRGTLDNTHIQLKKGTETWGARGRFGMTPLANNCIYWYACVNTEANSTVHKNWSIHDLYLHFAAYHASIPEIILSTQEERLIWNDIIDIKPLKKFAFGSILLIGDAAHATTPNMGQGACQALEDAAVLVDELKKEKNIQMAFLNFEKRRLKRTRYITETSWMIGKVAQWENPFLVKTRNILMKNLPYRLQQYKLNKLLNVDFMSINNTR